MTPRLTWEHLELQLRNPFRVAYGTSDVRYAFWLRLAGDEAWGEGTIPPYYGISDESMIAVWSAAAERTDAFPDDPADIAAWVGTDGPAPARAALDLALHDRIGRREGLPLHKLLELPDPKPLLTSFTLGINEPEIMAQQAADLPDYSVLKLKLGTPDDEPRVAAVRNARPDATLYIDANAGWSADDAIRQIERLMAYDIALVEQPVPKADIAGMGRCRQPVRFRLWPMNLSRQWLILSNWPKPVFRASTSS
ncbi:MAG: enolase C-terminal domain-like protein [Chloroflexota bacterium]